MYGLSPVLSPLLLIVIIIGCLYMCYDSIVEGFSTDRTEQVIANPVYRKTDTRERKKVNWSKYGF
jgi:hypothetical protein